MGWLRDFMSQAGLRSFGELAREALAHPEWPEDTKARPRSLEAILGRLDRREELDWLVDRPGVQQILASLLKLNVAEVRTILIESSGPRPIPGRLRLDDVRRARSLDLATEPLPPTMPKRLELPATWQRCCWLTEPGAGRAVVGQWLTSRGLAQTAEVASLDAIATLPKAGPPLYVKMATHCLEDFLRNWNGIQPLCLAVASPADTTIETTALSQFEVMRSTPATACLEQIVDWVLFRMSAQPSGRRRELLEWLSVGPVAWDIVRTLGDVLGLIGAFLEGTFEPNPNMSKDELLRQWTSHRAGELAREKLRDVAALGQLLPEILIEIAQSALIDESRPILESRSIEEWLALVPEQHRRGPDIEWLTARLVSDHIALRKPDLERAAERLPPGAHRIVVALRELYLLKPTSASSFALRPHFLGRLIHSIAKARVSRSSPLFWGEAILRPTARVQLLPDLYERAMRQPEALAEDTLESLDLENPALVCAFESAFVLLGMAHLSGTELSDSIAGAVLEEQAALLLTGNNSIACPRTIPTAPAGLSDLPGTFHLAAWALSEHARLRRSSLPPSIDPWHSQNTPVAWGDILDDVADAIHQALVHEANWLSGALKLLDRLRQCVGAQMDASNEPHRLFIAGAFLDAVSMGVLDWDQVESIQRHQPLLGLLLASATARNLSREELMRAIGQAWLDCGLPSTVLKNWVDWAPDSIKHMPAEILAELLLSKPAALSPAIVASLPAAAWQAWIVARGKLELDQEPEHPWVHAPLTFVERATTLLSPARGTIRQIVWQRHPDCAIAQVERHRSVTPEVAADWLRDATGEQAPRLAKTAVNAAWLRSADVVIEELQRVMQAAVRDRVRDWQIAYDCLNRVIVERRRFEAPRSGHGRTSTS